MINKISLLHVISTQGPECESLEMGKLNGRDLLFVGVDRSASILIYSFPTGSPIPVFESIHRAGGTSDTFSDLLDDRNLGDLDPEDLRYICFNVLPCFSF